MLVYCDDDFVENIVFTGQRQQKMFISLFKILYMNIEKEKDLSKFTRSGL